MLLYTFGYYWIETEYVKADYKKYLGPDWKPTYEGSGTIVSNHNLFLDIYAAVNFFKKLALWPKLKLNHILL